MLIANPKGNYSFLRGISPYSAGAVAAEGHQIEHARFARALPLKQGFERISAHMGALGRPRAALCAMELRSPKPFSFAGFNEFNAGYVEMLKAWDILLDGLNPVARTNVAPEINPPAEPSVYGFSYTVASKSPHRTFVVAGAGELPEGSLDPHDVIRRGETTAGAMREKARFVMGLMSGRLQGLGVNWNDATVTELYTVHAVDTFISSDVFAPMERGQLHGLTWHFARPPIVSIEFEMDLRGCAREIVLE